MRFSAAALMLLAASPVADAFSPKAFGAVRLPRTISTTKLLSTTEEEAAIYNDIDNIGETNPKALPEKEHKTTLSLAKTRTAMTSYLNQHVGQSGAAAVYFKLEENGVKVVNGYSGGAVLPLLDQFHPDNPIHEKDGVKKTPIRWITNSNENSAGHIAEGYAKSQPLDDENLPVGVVVATSGPGVTNLITPLQDAICDGVPMVVLCGQAATTAPKDAFQACPAVALTTPCTKWSYQIKSAVEVPMVMDYAFFVARNGRPGPVFVDLPKDLQNQMITENMVDSYVNHLFDSSDNSDFATFVSQQRANGQVFQSLQLGNSNQKLGFELTEGNSNSYKLEPAASSDLYGKDHHPTNTIIRSSKEGEGPLEVGSAITEELMKLILRARKPVILAGQGCNDSSEELKEFAEKLQIPVCTTLHALGVFDERHDLALNMIGMHGHATPNYLVQDCDLLINIGSRFDDRITGLMTEFVPEAKKAASEARGGIIHVDIRMTENKKQLTPTYFVHSTGKTFLQTMNKALEGVTVKPKTRAWLERKDKLQTDYPVRIPPFPTEKVEIKDEDGKITMSSRTCMSAQSVISEMNRQLLDAGKIEDLIVSTGVGVHQMIAAQLVTWVQTRTMLSSGSLGTMGVSLGYIIGAKLANMGKICISIDGDGSFNMTFTELKTVAEEKIPIKIIILDNEAQMMVEFWQTLFHDNRLLAVRNDKNPDYCTLASAFGIKSLYCDHEEDLPEKMKEFLFSDPDEPVILHARIERTPCLPMVAPGQPLDDMILEHVDRDFDGGAAPS